MCCDSRRPEFLGEVDGPGHGHLANTYDQEVARAYCDLGQRERVTFRGVRPWAGRWDQHQEGGGTHVKTGQKPFILVFLEIISATKKEKEPFIAL